jgi:hypothetical protein
METRIDNVLIDKCIADFPNKGKWKSFRLRSLQGNNKKIIWNEVKEIPMGGGLYAFSFPIEEMNGGFFTIDLDGPQKSKIEFRFSINDFPAIPGKHFVLYIGKTTSLYKRLQLHLRKTKTATQVLYGLKKIFKTDLEHIRRMLIQSGIFYYLSLPDVENCVNRDIIELGLCAKYRAPINIKSER